MVIFMHIELEKFICACIEKGKYEELGNSKMGNKQYTIIKSAYLSLKKAGRLDDMTGLLEHENPYVRLWAASYMLPILPTKSENTLKELSTLKGKPVAFSAQMTLQEWRKGNLKFPTEKR